MNRWLSVAFTCFRRGNFIPCYIPFSEYLSESVNLKATAVMSLPCIHKFPCFSTKACHFWPARITPFSPFRNWRNTSIFCSVHLWLSSSPRTAYCLEVPARLISSWLFSPKPQKLALKRCIVSSWFDLFGEAVYCYTYVTTHMTRSTQPHHMTSCQAPIPASSHLVSNDTCLFAITLFSLYNLDAQCYFAKFWVSSIVSDNYKSSLSACHD